MPLWFGNRELMAIDPKLKLEGKPFLEERKKGEDSASRPIPNAIHLLRCGDFILGIPDPEGPSGA
jgi:chromodomain-helicase-DNA-binding protein 1